MKGLFYRCISFLSRIFGLWIVSASAWIIVTAYFILMPGRTANSVRFYRALYPGRNVFYHVWCAWRQYHHFSTVFVDRLIFEKEEGLNWVGEGLDHLSSAAKRGEYGILLTSHFGNWEAAARGLQTLDFKILLYMGSRQYEQIEAQIKKDLADHGITIIAVPKDAGTQFEGLAGLRFLRNDGFVAMAGDLLWNNEEKSIKVKFLGHDVFLPQAPYVFALVLEAPIFVFFVMRTGRAKYRIVAHPPIYVKAGSREHREAAIQNAAQQYVSLLEQTVRQYPDHWYHFTPMWIDGTDSQNIG
ncbi:MAG: lysophospholipid acyltransferase family protein [Deltaproteobacteria bacterium]|nr:lysophospholipid acyltransferase family protein [Deltaproteobacteria bacterium]MCL5793045.1 lysophospholipid acyltransferase family protein [Deltaproteobacteria bacterium]